MSNQYRSVLAGAAGTGGDALPANVLSGKTFTNDNGPQTGTMVNRGAVSGSATPSTPYTIPEGYHNGSGTVTATATPSFPATQTYTNSNYNQSSDSHAFTVPEGVIGVKATLSFGGNTSTLCGVINSDNSFTQSADKKTSVNTFSFVYNSLNNTVTFSVATEVVGITSITINLDVVTM